ncbi:MAG TPA: hypothetical protein PLZ93_22220 [Nocardioides sp.]|uniref:hypothetical protein n=1 Tax=uncultured Nocardioides sp. TaxID=198441 RepID=UPI00262AC747|nr:hypothetical protein [uncultured Nocardioides sp.]HRI98357.1 hypothetical protein [Nocardioides sp.]
MPLLRTHSGVCRSCRRAARRQRSDHQCYGAVVDESQNHRTAWRACACDCQRTLAALGFFDADRQPPTEATRASVVR